MLIHYLSTKSGPLERIGIEAGPLMKFVMEEWLASPLKYIA